MALKAPQAHQRAKPGGTVIGCKLDRDQRRELLLQFPARFRALVADHATLSARVDRKFGWEPLELPMPAKLEPAAFR